MPEPIVLSPREYDVAELTARALSGAQMASALGVTHGTLKVYRVRIYAKLGLTNFEGDCRVMTALMFLAGLISKTEPAPRRIRTLQALESAPPVQATLDSQAVAVSPLSAQARAAVSGAPTRPSTISETRGKRSPLRPPVRLAAEISRDLAAVPGDTGSSPRKQTPHPGEKRSTEEWNRIFSKHIDPSYYRRGAAIRHSSPLA